MDYNSLDLFWTNFRCCFSITKKLMIQIINNRIYYFGKYSNLFKDITDKYLKYNTFK